MKLHCRTRKGNLVRITVRTGKVHLWRFLAEHNAWLRVCRGGYAPSAAFVMQEGRGMMMSGVEGLGREEPAP